MGDGPSTTTDRTADTSPWSGQQPYLLDAFRRAEDTYNRTTAQGAYTGQQVAAPTQQQYDAYGNAVTSGYNAQGVNNGMMNAGAGAYGTGTAGMAGAMSNLNAIGSNDQTAANITRANEYVSGLDINGQVDAGMREANRNAAEGAIPNIYRQAAASGGINSDRAALSQGIVERGLAEQSAGLSAQLHNDAYKQGMTFAQQENQQGIMANASAGSIGNEMARNGYLATNAGVNNQATVNAQITGGANGATGLDQQTINDLMARYNGGQQFSWAQLQNLMGIVGGRPWGSQEASSQTVQTNPSLMQNIGSGLSIAGDLFCDRNIKHVLCETGGTWRGFPEYYFTYRDDHLNKVHRGPMAQDVELTHPHAVAMIGNIKVILTDKL